MNVIRIGNSNWHCGVWFVAWFPARDLPVVDGKYGNKTSWDTHQKTYNTGNMVVAMWYWIRGWNSFGVFGNDVLGNDVLINDAYLLFSLCYHLKSVISRWDVTPQP